MLRSIKYPQNILQCLIVLLWLNFGLKFLVYSEEIQLKNNKVVVYQSIFSMDSDGITLRMHDGLIFVQWLELDQDTAKRVSYGKYPDILQKKPEIQTRKASLPVVEPGKHDMNMNSHEYTRHVLEPVDQKSVKAENNETSIPNTKEEKRDIASTSLLNSADLDMLFNGNENIWLTDSDEFVSMNKSNQFEWVSASDKKEIRSSYKKLRFLGFQVWEIILRCQDGKIAECVIYIYNRGDAGFMGLGAFEELNKQVKDKINAWTNQEPFYLQDRLRAGGIKIQSCAWFYKSLRIDCEWSSSKNLKRAEFLRLRISPRDRASKNNTSFTMPEDRRPKELSFYDLKQNVHKSKNGDVVITGIPMVDQGNKGYCAVAVAERVLRYYGRNIDQHELAQIALTSSDLGTNPDTMLEALRKIGRRMEISVQKHNDFSAKEFMKLLTRYNKIAKKRKISQIYPGREVYSVADIYKKMDRKILKALCLEKDVEKLAFEVTIKKYINVGVPLSWSVVTGIVDEKPKVLSSGGHMRLIIGYNDTAAEIIYTDTWGSGHEEKRMRLVDAWMITMGLYTTVPRNWNYADAGMRDIEREKIMTSDDAF